MPNLRSRWNKVRIICKYKIITNLIRVNMWTHTIIQIHLLHRHSSKITLRINKINLPVTRKDGQHWKRKITYMSIIHIRNTKSKNNNQQPTHSTVETQIWCRTHNMMRAMQLQMNNLTITNQFKHNKNTEEIWACLKLLVIIIIIYHSRCKFQNKYRKAIIVAKNNTIMQIERR